MSRFILALGIILGLYALLRIGVTFASSTPATGGVENNGGTMRLGDCSTKPNCQGSQSSRKKQTVDALPIALDPKQAMQTITAAMTELGAKVVSTQDHYLHATFKTPVMGYLDDVEFLVDTENTLVHIRSASRLGHSDLGANKKRIDKIRAHLAGRL